MFISPIKNIKFSIPNFKNKDAKQKSPNFKSTSAGAPLKVLTNITDPYFGGKMIPMRTITKAEKILDKRPTVELAIKSLNQFQSKMQLVERVIFDKFSYMKEQYVDAGFNDILKSWYHNALDRLKYEEFAILESMNELSFEMHPLTARIIREKTEKCKQIISENDPMNKFKRKTILCSLEEIIPDEREIGIFNKLKKCANLLPTSNTSEYAFIVKYADRTHEEIAKRLIRASGQTVDHVNPDSLGGENCLDNFTLASFAANSLKGNMKLYEFIDMYPQVVPNSQLYINDIIRVIHRGGLRGNYTYPYRISRTFACESNGLINLNLSKYKLSEKDAEKLELEAKTNYRRK